MFLLFLLLVLSCIFIDILYKKYRKHSRKHPPGPPGLPFTGNFHQFDTEKPHEFLWKLSKKYGPLMSLQFGCVPILVISSARMAKEALKHHDLAFSGKPALVGQQKLSYNGVDLAFSPYGEYWREMRKICVLHLFSLKQVQSFRPIREVEVSDLVQKISKIASSCEIVNLSKLMMSFTSTIICRIAFGKRYDNDGHERKRFDELLNECQAMLAGLFVADYFPSFGWVDKLSGMDARLLKNFKELDSFYQGLIEERVDPNRPKTMKGDILDLLIKIKEEKTSAIDITWEHIKAILMNIFVAGTDTGAAAIVWAMTALMKRPSKLMRIQTEIRDYTQKKGKIGEENLHELHYLKAVIKETLRLYPPAPLLVPRETIDRCNIEGYEIEPKTLVYVNAWAIARDPECWENPDEFLPERFLNSNLDVKGKHFEVIPFGAGRRACPGISLGLATVELALANLLNYFDWELPPGVKIKDIDTDVLPGITMHKKNALCLVAKKFA